MLNLFSYAEQSSDEEVEANDVKSEPTIASVMIINTDEGPKMGQSKDSSTLFSALPKAKKAKKSKQKKILEMAKFAKVPVEELLKEMTVDSNKKDDHNSSSMSTSTSNRSDSHYLVQHKNLTDDDTEPVQSNGVIPLNPFLADSEAITSSVKEPEPIHYQTIYHPTNATVSLNPQDEKSTYGYGYGYGYSTVPDNSQGSYGVSYSQSQYEAFIRKSGMMATANVATSSRAELLGNDAKFYDKQTKRALEEGSFKEISQDDVHDFNEQPGSEYWEKRRIRTEVAKEFGKLAHLAPTQVAQTRNQVTSMAIEAIVALAENGEKRSQERSKRRETRAKYGW